MSDRLLRPIALSLSLISIRTICKTACPKNGTDVSDQAALSRFNLDQYPTSGIEINSYYDRFTARPFQPGGRPRFPIIRYRSGHTAGEGCRPFPCKKSAPLCSLCALGSKPYKGDILIQGSIFNQVPNTARTGPGAKPTADAAFGVHRIFKTAVRILFPFDCRFRAHGHANAAIAALPA